jgi:hypothetical protein
MTLIVLTIVIVALVIAALAVYLFTIGTLLSRTAGNLSDCLQNVKSIAGHAYAIGPGVTRINQTGGELVGAMSLLLEDAEGVAALAASATAAPAKSSATVRPNVGELDAAPATGVGYLDT